MWEDYTWAGDTQDEGVLAAEAIDSFQEEEQSDKRAYGRTLKTPKSRGGYRKEATEVEGGREPQICTTKVLGRNLYKQVIDVQHGATG